MKKKLQIILASLFILIILLLIISPMIIRPYVVNNSKELIGRQVAIGDFGINYFTMSVTLEEFVLFEDDAKTPFVSFNKLYINLALLYLFTSELVVQEMVLDGLEVNAVQYDSSFNFDSMASYFDSDDEDSISMDTTISEPYKFHLSNLEMKNGKFNYYDSVLYEDVNLVDLNLFIPYIGWNQDEASDAGLKFFFSNGGYFQSSFQMDPVTGNFNTELTIDDLDLSTFYGFSKGYLALDTLKGSLNTSLIATGNTNYLDSVLIEGRVDLTKLHITSGGHKNLVYIDSLFCNIETLQPLILNYQFDSLHIIRPNILFELYDSTNNFMSVFEGFSKSETEENEIETDAISTDYPLYYSLNSFKIIDGSLDLFDYQYDQAFSYRLSNIEMDVKSINSGSDWINLTSSMTLNNKGNLIAELGLNPNNPMDMELQYAISDFRLSDLNIYTNHFIGHDIIFGDLNHISEVKINDGQIESENKLIIRDIEMDKVQGGLFSLPLKLALFIIKDKNGDATMHLPVRGDLNDPQLSLGKLVWSTFKNFVFKIASAPYNFLAGLVSADPSDLKEVNYDFADTVFSTKKQKQMDLLLKLEEKKEGLAIKLVYFVDIEREKEKIAIGKAEELFTSNTNLDPKENKAELLNFIRESTNNDTIDLQTGSYLMIGTDIIDSLATSFSDYRVQQIDSYLHSKNDSTSIKVNYFQNGVPKNVGSAPSFHVKYSIEGDSD